MNTICAKNVVIQGIKLHWPEIKKSVDTVVNIQQRALLCNSFTIILVVIYTDTNVFTEIIAKYKKPPMGTIFHFKEDTWQYI